MTHGDANAQFTFCESVPFWVVSPQIEVTVKLVPLLATPPTVTTTAPVVAPVGTVAVMVVAFQTIAAAAVPLNVIVLVPCVDPKFVPVMVTEAPIGPAAGPMPLIVGGGTEAARVNVTPLLATPPTVTTTLPVVAATGTVAMMLVALQLVAVAGAPLKVTVLVPCVAPKFAPPRVTEVPTGPDVGDKPKITGAPCNV